MTECIYPPPFVHTHAERSALNHDEERIARRLSHDFLWFEALSPLRQHIFVDMNFCEGSAGLEAFAKIAPDVGRGDYTTAAYKMLQGVWHRHAERHVNRLVLMMLNDADPELVLGWRN